ncbi:DUF397 domain-containing protein [Actinoplanes sp. TFC3]|uniref:DUF397 domain-containing protein n=1 Tax=Actinoplanes sp. TFC3 TaxID=1710355 RepID=UPI00082D065A|nr:DUF397 domain-containing protein [Actinoplanes sp. TFC3]
MHEDRLVGARWHTSTRSGANGDCVEVAENLPGIVAVRDSKNQDRNILIFPDATWCAFVAGIKNGDFDQCR